MRALGSAALNMAMVALGGADANFEYGIHAWDIAAGDLIVREAGGVVIDPSGGPLDLMSRRVLAASSQELANELSKALIQFFPEPRDWIWPSKANWHNEFKCYQIFNWNKKIVNYQLLRKIYQPILIEW